MTKSGREFQAEEPATENERLPNVDLGIKSLLLWTVWIDGRNELETNSWT